MRLLILLGFAFWMVACTPSGKQTSSKEALSSDRIQYAQGFTVQRFDTYTMVEVRDPWDSTRLLQRYLLVDRTKSVPGGLPKGTIVKVPVKDIVVYTSVHAAIIDQLHEINKVIGVCEPREDRDTHYRRSRLYGGISFGAHGVDSLLWFAIRKGRDGRFYI